MATRFVIPYEETEYISKRVIELFDALRGDRTGKEMAEDTGISATYLSELRNSRKLPSREVIERITDPATNPQGGVTAQDFIDLFELKYLEESGKQTKVVEVNDKACNYYSAELLNNNKSLESEYKTYNYMHGGGFSPSGPHRKSFDDAIIKRSAEKMRIKEALVRELAGHYTEENIIIPDVFYEPDYSLHLMGYDWDFFFCLGAKVSVILKDITFRSIFTDDSKNRKITIITEDPRIYKALRSLEGKLATPRVLSVIFYNNGTLWGETVLSQKCIKDDFYWIE